MNTRIRTLAALIAATVLVSSAALSAEDEHRHKEPATGMPSGDSGKHEPGMHMHKSDITHMNDSEAANEFKGEAAHLRAQAESHRKLAKLYQSRTAKGGVNYAAVAKHCEQLAKAYEDAAKAADTMSSELSK